MVYQGLSYMKPRCGVCQWRGEGFVVWSWRPLLESIFIPLFQQHKGLIVKFCSQGSSEENYLAASRSEILLVMLNRTIYRKILFIIGLYLNLSSCHFLVVSLVQNEIFYETDLLTSKKTLIVIAS